MLLFVAYHYRKLFVNIEINKKELLGQIITIPDLKTQP